MPERAVPSQSERRFPERESVTPGPRRIIRLNIADQSIPSLLDGIDAARCWLTEEGDGVYGFHASQTLGESRKQPGTPSADLLHEIANDLADMLDDPEVPQRLRDRRDVLVEHYIAQTAPASREETP